MPWDMFKGQAGGLYSYYTLRTTLLITKSTVILQTFREMLKEWMQLNQVSSIQAKRSLYHLPRHPQVQMESWIQSGKLHHSHQRYTREDKANCLIALAVDLILHMSSCHAWLTNQRLGLGSHVALLACCQNSKQYATHTHLSKLKTGNAETSHWTIIGHYKMICVTGYYHA